jgi:hypothetical protein
MPWAGCRPLMHAVPSTYGEPDKTYNRGITAVDLLPSQRKGLTAKDLPPGIKDITACLAIMEPAAGFAPATSCLQGRCSAE